MPLNALLSIKTKYTDKPWANETFLALISQRNQCKKRQDWNNLNIQVKQMRDKLKNDYYTMKAKSINEASEARNVEEQFRLAKQYSALSNSNRLLIKPQLLTDHFKVHFSERTVVMQPEVTNHTFFPHILPPDKISINEDLPSEEEITTAIKSLNNNKCQGTDKIYAEQIKYSSSKSLVSSILITIVTVWSTITVPAELLKSYLSCLHKKCSKSKSIIEDSQS